MTRRTRTRGFTLIEVMMAIGIITVGAVGIMSMVQASTRGNAQARLITNATQNTQYWVDRLQRLSVRWTQDAQTGVTGIPYLDRIKNAQTSGWFIPDATLGADGIAGMDWQGNHVGMGGSHYCTLLNLSWITVGRSMRAEVVTYFARRMEDTSVRGTGNFSCTAGGVGAAVITELGTPLSTLSSVRAATVLRWRPL